MSDTRTKALAKMISSNEILTLINTEIPNNIYTFSSTTGTNEFTIETYETNGKRPRRWKNFWSSTHKSNAKSW